MIARLWYPQLDVYDSVRRMFLLLQNWRAESPSKERLYITDFYLANPPLLHNASMTMEVRKRLRELDIPKEGKLFLSYPAAPILYHKMEPVQRKALQALIGKGILNIEKLRNGIVEIDKDALGSLDHDLSISATNSEHQVIQFLVNDFAKMCAGDLRELRQKTGLRRTVA